MAENIMKKNHLIPALAMLLAGCAAPQQQPELNKLHNQIGKLNTEMRQLTQQAAALEQQNTLNSDSGQGAWLIPAANTAVKLQSLPGEFLLSLSNIESEANGSRAILHVRATDDKPLPTFTARIEWGEMDAATGKPLQIGSQSQAIHVSAALLPHNEITVPLRLDNISPEQLGYVRVHDIVAQTASAP